MKHGAAILELSPFTKIELSGRDAFEGLDFLASANIDRAVGTVVYTPLLNDAGGIEADVTILRKPDGHIRITSGAATRWRHLHWLRRNLDGDIVITDVTEDHSVIGVMGAASRTIRESPPGRRSRAGVYIRVSFFIVRKQGLRAA